MSAVLLDIDGMLTLGPDVNHQSAVLAALDDVFDMQVPIDEFRQPGFQDLTTPAGVVVIWAAVAVRRGAGSTIRHPGGDSATIHVAKGRETTVWGCEPRLLDRR